MAEAEQTGNTSGQTPLPLWATIGDQDLADENPDPEEGAFIGEYPSDDALQGAVGEHPLKDYILAAIKEVRSGAGPSTETTSPQEGEAEAGSTSDQSPLPLWATIGVKELADENPDPEEGPAFIGEYSSDDALRSAVNKHSLRDYILAAIEEVRGGAAPSTETTSPHERGAKDAS